MTNRLLQALDPTEFQRLALQAETIPLVQGEVLTEEGEPVRHVYFPHSGVISLSVITASGASAECASIGREGFVGFGCAIGRARAYARYSVQIGGEATRIPSAAFLDALAGNAGLNNVVLMYAGAFVAQVLRLSVCNALHSVTQRAARWLLLTQDRAGATFDLTHEALATALGVRRATVSSVMQRLQQDGLIRYGQKSISVLDRDGIELLSCDCYTAIAEVFATLSR